MLRCINTEGLVTPAKTVIKKYGNRRLYDTSASRYINLEEIASLVRNGTDVQVLDAKSGEDLTRLTLTQIIVEEAKDQPSGLPLELLRQLILASDKVRQEFMSWYLKSAFDSYEHVQSAVQSGLSQVGSAAVSPLESLSKLFLGDSSTQKNGASEINELRQRIVQLEGLLTRRKQATKNRSKKRKSTH
jgi:polyhydroxyalkanoate synthesis repressor PhaR